MAKPLPGSSNTPCASASPTDHVGLLRLGAFVLVVASLTSACGPEFDPYNLVKDFRVLALRADNPTPAEGETATIDALVYSEGGETPTYNWSWCPFSTGAGDGYQCAITEEELQGAIDEMAPDGFNFQVPSFDLGSEPTADFVYTIPSIFFQVACEALQMQDIPEFVQLPQCEGTFPILIRLETATSEDSIIAVRELDLVIDPEAPRNTNPSLEGFSISGPGLNGITSVGQAPNIEVVRNEEYTLRVEVPGESAERYVPFPTDEDPEPDETRETLALTWFVEGGDTDSTRTGYIEGEVPLIEAEQNAWVSPTREDYDRQDLVVFVVIRDGRGGIGWITRRLPLAQ